MKRSQGIHRDAMVPRGFRLVLFLYLVVVYTAIPGSSSAYSLSRSPLGIQVRAAFHGESEMGGTIFYRLVGDEIENVPVRVEIFDPSGRHIRTLLNTRQGPGEYSIYWDGTDDSGKSVDPGIYFCSIRSRGDRETIVVYSGSQHGEGTNPPSIPLNGPYDFMGPEGGIVLSLASSALNPGIVFAGTEWGGGIYKSTDSGDSWTLRTRGLTDFIVGILPAVQSLAVDPVDPNRVYACASPGGLFRSTNGGESWESIGSFSATGADAIAINPLRTTTLYAFVNLFPSFGDVYKSVDGGDTWSNVTNDLTVSWIYDIAINPGDTSQVLLATINGVHESTDGGESWQLIEGGLPIVGAQTLAIDPISSSVLYAGYFQSGIYKSTDGGENWFAINEGLEDSVGVIPAIDVLAIDPLNPEVIYAALAEAGVYRSTSGGSAWAPYDDGLTNQFCDSLKINDLLVVGGGSPRVLAATGDIILCAPGVFANPGDGSPWVSSNSGLYNTTPLSLVYDPTVSGQFFVGTRDNGIYRTTDGGTTWAAVNDGITFPVIQKMAIDPGSPSTLYAGTGGFGLGHGMFKSIDGGNHWVDINEGISDSSIIYTVIIDPVTLTTLYCGTEGDGVFRTTNGGALWEGRSNGISDPMIGAFAIDPRNHLTVYTGAWAGMVYKSTNGGEEWLESSNGLTDIKYASSLTIDPDDPDVVYLTNANTAYGNGVYRSTDAGGYWKETSNGLADTLGFVNVYELVIDPFDSNTLYVGSESPTRPLFRSTNGGDSWHPYALDIFPPGPVMALGIDPFESTILHAGMFAFGLARVDVTQVGIGSDEVDSKIPRTFSLAQNYPNPFNPSTTVRYEIPEVSKTGVGENGRVVPVRLYVYDIRGRLVRRLVDEGKFPGRYQVHWDGRDDRGIDLGSGVYLYRIEVDKLRSSRKMVLVR